MRKAKKADATSAGTSSHLGDRMGDTGPSGDSFDLVKLQQLFEMMEKHGVTDVQLRNGDVNWRLRRGAFVAAPPAVVAAAPVVTAPVAAAPAAAPATPAAAPDPHAGHLEIKSPTVGTFYAAPTPEDPAFVQVGTKVSRETIVCLIEAMKVFNQIPAEIEGTVTAVLVKNGDPIEFGQPLFRVKA